MNAEVRPWDSDRLLSLELRKRLNVTIFKDYLKFVCGHVAKIGSEGREECYSCRLEREMKGKR